MQIVAPQFGHPAQMQNAPRVEYTFSKDPKDRAREILTVPDFFFRLTGLVKSTLGRLDHFERKSFAADIVTAMLAHFSKLKRAALAKAFATDMKKGCTAMSLFLEAAFRADGIEMKRTVASFIEESAKRVGMFDGPLAELIDAVKRDFEFYAKDASLEAFAAAGWTVKRDDGRQVILERHGIAQTRYRFVATEKKRRAA